MRIPVFFCAVLAALPWAASAQTDLNRTPSRVVGHPSLQYRGSNPNLPDARSLYSPLAVAVDTTSTPNAVFVADTLNNRILAWRDAASFASGARADLIMGQNDEVSTDRQGPAGGRQNGFALPGALAIDSKGSLYVVDAGNNRILRFPKPFGNNDEIKFPDLVIGQPNFSVGTVNTGGVSETSISLASGSTIRTSGLAFDPQGNLWLSDPGNNRVLRYPKSALDAAINGPAADLVLGEPDFRTTNRPSLPSEVTKRLNKSIIEAPSGLAVDNDGRVYVAEANARVLVFTPPFVNGKDAARIVGVWFTEAGTLFNNPEYALGNPEGLAIQQNRLVVADASAHRVLRYDPFSEWPAETETIISPPAKAVLGQNDFGLNSTRPNRGQPEPNGSTVTSPFGLYVAGNDLWVADTGNNRILVFPTFGPQAASTRVLGQPALNYTAPNILEGRELWMFNGFDSASNLANGGGVVIDTRSNPPHLYIADTYNNRVLGYRDARRVRPGDMADIVIGQSDLTRSLANAAQGNPDVPTSTGLFRPIGVVVDTNGDLFVADTGNGRVLRFPSPFAQQIAPGDRHRANLVIGQRDFSTKFTDPSRSNMQAPYGVALTIEGHLVVSDAAHNRVLFFRRPPGSDFVNGQNAEKVVGQPDFFTTARVTAPNRMFSPRHIAVDTDDRLYVADGGNNRVLIYDRIPTAASVDPPVAFTLPNITGAQAVWVSRNTGEIWVAAARLNPTRVQRFPRFELLSQGIQTDYEIPVATPLALTQDEFGSLFVAEANNRVSLYFNGQRTQIAGNYAERPLAPGSIGIVYPLGSSTFTTETKTFDSLPNPIPMPKELGDVQVLLNDRPVPLYFIHPTQINFFVPFDMPNSGTVELQVVKPSNGQVLAAGTVPMAPVAPALFAQGAFAEGALAAVNVADGTINSPANRVARGQYISLYATGLGEVDGPPAEGTPPSGAVPGKDQVRVLIEPRIVEGPDIQYFGLAPGLIGVYQINVRVPIETAPGDGREVVVMVRSMNSNQGAGGRRLRTTISVKE